MPITGSPTTEDFKTDKFINQEIHTCNTCGCIQTKFLIDPALLYSNAHNQTHTFQTWAEHHQMFYNFIMDNRITNTVLEIGGSSGVLYQKFKMNDSSIQYKCLDICESSFDNSDIDYIKANCEDYAYLNDEEIVLSHVFEHLYNPSNFIKNISKNIKSVFISIPNMDYLLNNKAAFILNNEHTYYIDKSFMEYLFSQYGYKLQTYQEFKTHSLFFHFVKVDIKPLLINYRDYISKQMISNFNTCKDRFNNLKLNSNSFIVPAGLYGQFAYTRCNPDKILGFLDNDTSKQYRRVYGTNYIVYPFDKLKDFNDNIYIYIYDSIYSSEIVKQIQTYNKKNNIIIIYI